MQAAIQPTVLSQELGHATKKKSATEGGGTLDKSVVIEPTTGALLGILNQPNRHADKP